MKAVPYPPVFYPPPALLHLSVRLPVAGDLLGQPGWRSAGGILNAITLLVFVLNTLGAVMRGIRTRRKQVTA